MNMYQIPYVCGQPVWEEIPVLEVSNIQWIPDVGVRMTQQVCYNDFALHIRQKAVEKHIRAECCKPQDYACQDSCMEFFFCPDPADSRYFNFEITPSGFMYLGLGKGRADSVRLFPENYMELFKIRPGYTSDGWMLTYEIPFTFIRSYFPEFEPKPGVVIRANCYKCGDLTAKPHYLSWNPCAKATPDFHVPEDFGTMILSE